MNIPLIEMMFRTIVAFISLYTICRILGKKLISQLTFFDFVAGITIGSVAANIMFQPVKITTGIIGMTTFGALSLLSGVIAIKSLKGRKVLDGEPTILIKNGKILEEGMKKNRLTMDQLLLNLRKKNVFYIDQVETALLETDGTLSVLKKPMYLNATQQDLQRVNSSRGLPEAFIVDGEILQDSLKSLGKDMEWVNHVLKVYHVENIKHVFYAQVDQQGNVYLDTRQDT